MSVTEKREDYITWDEYFMGVAILSGKRSKDPSTQVGACIVSQDNKILSMGYNGFPKGCSDDEFPWGKEHEKDDPYNAKYFYSTHSELNAILNYRGGSLEDPSCMSHCFRAMNVQRPSSSRGSRRSSTAVISTTGRRRSMPPSAC